jgi:hypothetical protein
MTDAYVPLTGVPDLHGGTCTTHLWPDLWQSGDLLDRQEAIRLCHTCTRMDDCLAWAQSQPNINGVWGGQVFEQGTKAAPPETQQRVYAAGPTKPAVCDHCGAGYAKPAARPNQRYCSPVCSRAARRRSWRDSRQRLRAISE